MVILNDEEIKVNSPVKKIQKHLEKIESKID